MKNDLHEFLENYYKPHLIQGLASLSSDDISKVSNEILDVVENGGRIFAFGNGGSEAIAEHLLYALEFGISDNYQFDTHGNPKTSYYIKTPIDKLFNPRIKRSARPGDLVFLISASGNSRNINNAAKLCRKMGIRTISISGDGAIVKLSDLPVMISLHDQQILEDITQVFIHMAVRILTDSFDRNYLNKIQHGVEFVTASMIYEIAFDVFGAFKSGNTIRVDAPDSGAIAISAGHTAHNFKWDAFQNARKRLSNNVHSGLFSYHLTGVSNDGGEGFNLAVEVDDNCKKDDVEIVFAKDLNDARVQRVIKVASSRFAKVHPVCFDVESEDIAADLTQITGHILGRTLNRIIAKSDLKSDLALLRARDKTCCEFNRKYLV
ncbi:SIS domain-containing protein [Patescibacteria group bacterium]|nr:SIS domain-containing protein [Patescibacteria group bacterium]